MHRKLTPAAEAIRQKIQGMIPEVLGDGGKGIKATVLKDDGKGNKMYGGKALAAEVSALMKEMGFGEVRSLTNGPLSKLMAY
jgi:hypothetical protein